MTNSGARGTRKEAQFAALLKNAGWLVEGPKPRARFGRTDYFGAFDLIAMRTRDPPLFVQLTGGGHEHAKRKRIEADARLLDAVLPHSTVLVASWGVRKRTGRAWRVQRRLPSEGWYDLGFVRLDGTVVDANGGTLAKIAARSRSTPRKRGNDNDEREENTDETDDERKQP